jgi:hypothetical protein
MPASVEDLIVLRDDPPNKPWDRIDRAAWLIAGLIGAFVIATADRDPISAVLWLIGSVIRGWQTIPRIVASARTWGETRHFLVIVALGWALIPGPLFGSIAGVLAPLIWDLPITSFQGGLIGIFACPIVDATEGLVLVSLFFGGLRLYFAFAGLSWKEMGLERDSIGS